MPMQKKASSGSEKMLEIGEKLAAVRKAKGITQVQAAKAVGCTQSYLSGVENGKKAYSIGFVLDLISFYQVSYQTVFGENTAEDWGFDAPRRQGTAAAALELLQLLLENSGSALLEKGADEYLTLCIYSIFRQLYQANPHNTSKIFSASAQAENDAVAKLVSQMPSVVHSLIEGCKINRGRLELPVERGHQLREFVKECEELLEAQ